MSDDGSISIGSNQYSLGNASIEEDGKYDEENSLEEEKPDSGNDDNEIKLDSSKYEKIGILKDLNTVIYSDVVKKKVDGVKYYNDYKVIKKLGEGSVCKVKLVEKNNVKYALKIVNKKHLLKMKKWIPDENGKMTITTPLDGIVKEISILKKVNHRNLVKLYEIMNDKKKGKLYLVLEYCENGDLMSYDEVHSKFSVNKNIFKKYLKNKDNSNEIDVDKLYYSENQIRRFIRQIIRGLNYLHRIGIIHRDIKPNNILLDKNNECKIIDFNFSSILDKHWVDNVGNKVDCNDYFRPPEICDLNNEDNLKDYKGIPLDIWAIGITAFILSYKKFPFFSTNEDIFDLYNKIHEAKLEIPNTPQRSSHFKYFLKKCLEKDPNKRITSEKILDLKWVNMGEKENLKDQCKKAVKFKPTKEELNKDMDLFWIDYKYIKSFKEDERPVIKEFTNKLLKKIPNVKDGRKIKIKIIKKNKNDKNENKDKK
jgi:[calcium/calmodulin-dependent protein kinase] kinase